MTDPTKAALDRARLHAATWLESLAERDIAAAADADTVADALGRELPEGPSDAEEVVDLLVGAVEPGLVAMPSGRFFGFVIGGSHPAALAADWLVGAWDQNAVLRQVTPGVAAAEELAAAWLLDLLGLPAGSGVGFATGATTANFTGIAAARDTLLRRSGWDVSRGLAGGPAVRVLAGRERHDSVDLALRYAGLPSPDLVDVTTRAGCSRSRSPSASPSPTPRRWSCSRPATCTRVPATRSTRACRSPTSTAPGCTSTAPSGCGRPRPRRTGT